MYVYVYMYMYTYIYVHIYNIYIYISYYVHMFNIPKKKRKGHTCIYNILIFNQPRQERRSNGPGTYISTATGMHAHTKGWKKKNIDTYIYTGLVGTGMGHPADTIKTKLQV